MLNDAPLGKLLGALVILIVVATAAFYLGRGNDELADNPLASEIKSTEAIFSFPEWGFVARLPAGWRLETINGNPQDVLSQRFQEDIGHGQAGFPWFLNADLQPGTLLKPIAHYMLVTPERWNELYQVTGETLGKFGYLGQSPMLSEILREIDMVILKKDMGQNLQDYVSEIDRGKLRYAEESYQAGNMSESGYRDAKLGFFAQYRVPEWQTLAGGVETLLLAQSAAANYPDTRTFLFLTCTEGDTVIALNEGPFASPDLDYVNLFRWLKHQIYFSDTFCQ